MLVLSCASDIVASCSDEECRSALQAAMVVLTLNWLRAGLFQPGTNLAPVLTTVLSNALDCVCLDLADFVRHPHRIREMPHVREVAALVRAVCEHSGHSVTWPLPDGDPALRECIRQCAMHRPYFDYSGTTHEAHEERMPLILELVKISVCGIDSDTENGSVVSSPEEEHMRSDPLTFHARD